MILRLTRKGNELFQKFVTELKDSYIVNKSKRKSFEEEPRIDGGKDFIYRHNDIANDSSVTTTIYSCKFGEDMVVNDDHYNNSPSLKEFVKQELLEIV